MTDGNDPDDELNEMLLRLHWLNSITEYLELRPKPLPVHYWADDMTFEAQENEDE